MIRIRLSRTICPRLIVVAMCLAVTLLTACHAPSKLESEPSTSPYGLWKEHYQQAWAAIRSDDYPTAESHLLQAIELARDFDPTDRRLAETLDDLGRVYFQLANYDQAEQMQGQAVVELLLTKGPHDPDLRVFITRLGHIYAKQKRPPQTVESLLKDPYKIFGMGYFPSPTTTSSKRPSKEPLSLPEQTRRLQALIFEYERAGDVAAVEYLQDHFHLRSR